MAWPQGEEASHLTVLHCHQTGVSQDKCPNRLKPTRADRIDGDDGANVSYPCYTEFSHVLIIHPPGDLDLRLEQASCAQAGRREWQAAGPASSCAARKLLNWR